MFNIHQKLFLSKVFLGIAIIAFAIFLSLYISLQIQYNLAVEMLREHLKVIHDTETHNHDLKKYLSEKENQELNIFKEIKEIKKVAVENEKNNESEYDHNENQDGNDNENIKKN